MEGSFNSAADNDQEGEWKEFLQRLDEHGLSCTMSAEQLTACTSMALSSSRLNAMESLNPAFLASSHQSPPSPFTPSSIGFSPSLINPLIDPVHRSPFSLNSMADADKLSSSTSRPSEGNIHPQSSWLSTFMQSLQSHPASGLFPSSSHESPLDYKEELSRALSATTHRSALQLNPDLLQTGMNSLDEILEQMSNDFINYGAAGSLQEHLSNALTASNEDHLKMGGDAMSTLFGASSHVHENIDSAQINVMLSTPASSVSSDGGPEDDSSSHEDTSNPLGQVEDFIMQSADTPFNVSATATPLRSPDTTSPQAGAKAETSEAPSSINQDQLKKRASKPARATKKPKRERGTKLAIKILSEVEVLDDGYKWRKYGQKPVKNSPYPRSYYKCTDKHCHVKKHVERQAQEPDYVVATYEGIHNHSRPDQQLQVLHSQSEHHSSFQPFMQALGMQSLSPMELLRLGPSSSLFPRDSQSRTLPLHDIINAQNPSESIDQGVFHSLFHNQPRTSSI